MEELLSQQEKCPGSLQKATLKKRENENGTVSFQLTCQRSWLREERRGRALVPPPSVSSAFAHVVHRTTVVVVVTVVVGRLRRPHRRLVDGAVHVDVLLVVVDDVEVIL